MLFNFKIRKYLASFFVLFVTQFLLAGGGSTVGNGGNTLNFTKYTLLYFSTTNQEIENKFTVIPKKMLNPSMLNESNQRCISFFGHAAQAWRLLAFDNVLGLSQDELHRLNNLKPRADLVDLWNTCQVSNVVGLCSGNYYHEAEQIVDNFGNAFIAINNSKDKTVTLNPNSWDVGARLACSVNAQYTTYTSECEDSFRESIALHEVLSLFFPEIENHFCYKYSSRYFYSSILSFESR